MVAGRNRMFRGRPVARTARRRFKIDRAAEASGEFQRASLINHVDLIHQHLPGKVRGGPRPRTEAGVGWTTREGQVARARRKMNQARKS